MPTEQLVQDLPWYQDGARLLLSAALLCFLAALAWLWRAGGSRAGGWLAVLGVLQSAALLFAGLQWWGYDWAAIPAFVLQLLLPAVFMPTAISLCNVTLRRRWLNLLNALAVVAVAAFVLWTYLQTERLHAFALLAWGLGCLACSVLEAVWQRSKARKSATRQRATVFLIFLLIWGLSWVAGSLPAAINLTFPEPLAAWPVSGLGQALSFLIFVVLMWPHRGPRVIADHLPAELLRTATQAALLVDGEGRVQGVNPAALSLLGRKGGEVLGQDLQQLLSLDVDYLDTVSRLHGAAYLERVTVDLADGRNVRELAVHPLVLRAKDGEVLALLCSLYPGSQDPALSISSLQDPVTQAAGAALGEALIAQELHRHEGGSGPLVAAVFVQLDDAARLLSQHGQVVYDRLQAAVVERLMAVCDWPVDVARSSGGGFVMLLTQIADAQEVQQIAQRTLEGMQQDFQLDAQPLAVSAVVSLLPDLRVYHDLLDVLSDARYGLEQARHAPHQVYVSTERAAQRTDLALGLENAIASDALGLEFELVMDLKRRQPLGFRVRCHWEPEGLPRLSDAEVRRLAQRVHLEGPLNSWRLRKAAEAAPKDRAWALWLPTTIEELQQAPFVKSLNKFKHADSLRILLDVPEAVWLMPAMRSLAAELQTKGYGLHAADFSISGVLSHASALKPRTANLDARLVQSARKDSAQLLKGLRLTASSMGVALLAQGVRKRQDLLRLCHQSVSLASGDYFGGRLSLEQLRGLLLDPKTMQGWFAGLDDQPDAQGRKKPLVD